jgi:hypothetical protein
VNVAAKQKATQKIEDLLCCGLDRELVKKIIEGRLSSGSVSIELPEKIWNDSEIVDRLFGLVKEMYDEILADAVGLYEDSTRSKYKALAEKLREWDQA